MRDIVTIDNIILDNDVELKHIKNLALKIEKSEKERISSNYDQNIRPLIKKFIIDNQLIAYGSLSYSELTASSSTVEIPLSISRYYYTVFSGSNNLELIQKLYNTFCELSKKSPEKYSFVQYKNSALYEYELYIEFNRVFVIKGLHNDQFSKLKTVKTKDSMKLLDPETYMLFIYKNYVTVKDLEPQQKVVSWYSSYIEEQLLNSTFDTKGISYVPKASKSNSYTDKLFDALKKETVVIGSYAYNILMKGAKFTPINYNLEVVSTDVKKTVDTIKRTLGNSSNIVTKEYDSKREFNLFKSKTNVYMNKSLVCEIYDSSDDCVPFNSIKDTSEGTIKIGSYHLILFYLYLNLFMSHMESQRPRTLYMINSLKRTREQYLKENNMIGIEKSPMKIFHFECYGKYKDLVKETKIKKWKGELKYKTFSHNCKLF